jgi:orotidine-5'-phosphate decarboxylase
MTTKLRNPIFCAIDTTEVSVATSLAAKVGDCVGGLKLGLEFFTANGIKGVQQVQKASGLPIFLDQKFHDIPNTVAGAVRAACQLGIAMLTIHTCGGRVMMEAAAKAATDAAHEFPKPRPMIIGVTVLTSMDDADLSATGVNSPVGDQVRRLAELAKTSGLDGIVCSPLEAAMLRADLGPGFKLITPGVRPVWSAPNDQKRFTSPADALKAGADYLVIGRPITAAADPAAAATRIVAEIAPLIAPAA